MNLPSTVGVELEFGPEPSVREYHLNEYKSHIHYSSLTAEEKKKVKEFLEAEKEATAVRRRSLNPSNRDMYIYSPHPDGGGMEYSTPVCHTSEALREHVEIITQYAKSRDAWLWDDVVRYNSYFKKGVIAASGITEPSRVRYLTDCTGRLSTPDQTPFYAHNGMHVHVVRPRVDRTRIAMFLYCFEPLLFYCAPPIRKFHWFCYNPPRSALGQYVAMTGSQRNMLPYILNDSRRSHGSMIAAMREHLYLSQITETTGCGARQSFCYSSRHPTIEFRVLSSTFDVEQIETYAQLCLIMVERAKEATDAEFPWLAAASKNVAEQKLAYDTVFLPSVVTGMSEATVPHRNYRRCLGSGAPADDFGMPITFYRMLDLLIPGNSDLKTSIEKFATVNFHHPVNAESVSDY